MGFAAAEPDASFFVPVAYVARAVPHGIAVGDLVQRCPGGPVAIALGNDRTAHGDLPDFADAQRSYCRPVRDRLVADGDNRDVNSAHRLADADARAGVGFGPRLLQNFVAADDGDRP